MKFLSTCTLIAMLILSQACKKDSGNGKVTFYTTDQSNWALIVDGKEHGSLKHATQMPVCGDPAFQNLSLSPGNHTVDARNLNGQAWGNPKTIIVKSNDCMQVKLP
ncbi:MAG: hypothetical protein WCO63_06215 [Bacteroidota bacterium]